MTALHLIYARARNGVIGHEGRMPWHVPEDLAHFKRATLGQPVIMGRKTWDSLPAAFRPLPGRRNIVITRQADWQAEGAQAAHSLERAIALCQTEAVAWVMGGAQIYRQALPLAEQIVVTEIDADFDGDAFAPELDASWREQEIGPWHTSSSSLPYRFVTYRRNAGAQPSPQPGNAARRDEPCVPATGETASLDSGIKTADASRGNAAANTTASQATRVGGQSGSTGGSVSTGTNYAATNVAEERALTAQKAPQSSNAPSATTAASHTTSATTSAGSNTSAAAGTATGNTSTAPASTNSNDSAVRVANTGIGDDSIALNQKYGSRGLNSPNRATA